MSLHVKDITVGYEKLMVIKHLSIDVSEGDFYSILGDSGSGKSTILKSIAGLLPLASGEIVLNEKNITSIPTKDRNIAYVFQKPLLFPHLSVEENIAFKLSVQKKSKSSIHESILQLAEIMGIEHLLKRMPNALSGGEQQRVSIARALIGKPSLVLMDEPFSNLDPNRRTEMGQWLKDLQKNLGLTILFVTHDVKEALFLSDRIGFLTDGTVIQEDTPNNIFYHPMNKQVALFLGPCNFLPSDNEDDSYYVIRPHEITIDKNGENYVVDSIKEIGKECCYVMSRGQQKVLVESMKTLDLQVGEQCDLIYTTKGRQVIWMN